MQLDNGKNVQAKESEIKRAVFSGGGAKGVVYAGAYQALVDTGMYENIHELSGASAGAITAALLACGMDSSTFRTQLLATNLEKLMGRQVGKIAGNSVGSCLITKDGQKLQDFVAENIKRSVESFFETIETNNKYQALNDDQKLSITNIKAEYKNKGITFSNLATLYQCFPDKFKKLTLTAVRLSDGALQVFDAERTPDVDIALACRASASIPVLLAPVTITVNNEEQQFIDGGLYDNLPIAYFQSAGLTDPIPNTLVFAFGEGLDNSKNPVFQALYGTQKNPKLYNPSFLERFKRDTLMEWLGGLYMPFKNTEQKEIGYQKLHKDYSLRTVELRVGDIKTTDFSQATRHARLLCSLGYLDTVNHLTNHELEDDKKFDIASFNKELINNFECILRATLVGSGHDPLNNALLCKIEKLRQVNKALLCKIEKLRQVNNELLCNIEKLRQEENEAFVNRNIYYLIKEEVDSRFDSMEAFALLRSVEFHKKTIDAEQLFKETYQEAFKRSSMLSVSNISGVSIFRSSVLLNTAITYRAVLNEAREKTGNSHTRRKKVFEELKNISNFDPKAESTQIIHPRDI